MDDGVLPDRDVAIDVGRRRILDRDTGRHQLLVLLLSHDSAHCRELGAAVDAANLVGIRDGDGFDDAPSLAENRHEVGQIVFALGVVGGDGSHGVEEALEREGVNAGIDLVDVALRRAGVALLDDTCNPLAGSDDSAVAVRVGHDRGDDRGRGARLSVMIRQILQGLRREQRHVAREEDQGAGRTAERRRCRQRMRGPELWLLHHEADTRVSRKSRFHRVRLVSDDDDRGAGLKNGGGRQDALDHREAGDAVQDFGSADFMRVPLPAARTTT